MDFVTQGYHSLLAALRNSPPAPMVRLRCGNRAVTLPSHLLTIGDTVECPSHPLLLAFLHTAECKCKCKTFLLSNSPLSPKQLEFLGSTPFGVKIVKPNATMLGLHLHSPHLSVTPRFSLQGDLLSPLPHVARTHVEKAQLNTAVSRMLQRVRAGTNLGLSFRERTLFLSFYVLSLPHYHHSTLIPSSNYIANYYRLIRQHLCKRAWIQAKHLPGVVTLLKVGILHCPRTFLLSSMLGLCIRLYGTDIVLWLGGLTSSLPFLPKRILEGLDAIRSETIKADRFNKEPFSHQLYRFVSDCPPPYKLARLVTRTFKSHVLQMLHAETRSVLRLRISQVDWLGDSSSIPLLIHFTQPLSKSFPPLHVLLFCVGLSILNQTCTFVSVLTLPDGPPVDVDVAATPRYTPKVFARVLLLPITSLTQTNGLLSAKPSLLLALIGLATAIRTPRYPSPHPLYGALVKVPLSMRFCPVPALVGSALLNRPWRTHDWSLRPTFSASHLAMIGALWVGTRQFVHERSGPLPPSPPPLLPWMILFVLRNTSWIVFTHLFPRRFVPPILLP